MIFKALFHTFVFFAIIFYIIYVFVVSEPCARIERTTKPIYLGGVVIQKVLTPWATEKTLDKFRDEVFKTQLRSALYVRKQFYYNAEEPVVCQWDAYAHIVGGQKIDPVEYKKQRELLERQAILEKAKRDLEQSESNQQPQPAPANQ